MRDRFGYICGICRSRAAALVDGLLAQQRPKRCILIVDDVRDVADVISIILRDAGYETHAAADGVEGLSRAWNLRPELILMNFMMPRMDGHEALRRLKKDPVLRNSKVVIHSAFGHLPEFRQRSLDLGALDCLDTPFDKKKLLAVVSRALSD